MKQNIILLILISLFCMGIISCAREKVVDDFIPLGRVKIGNGTIYNGLLVQLSGNETQLTNSDYIKLAPGNNQLIIWGTSGNPQNKPVTIFDSVLNVLPAQTYEFMLFQPSIDFKPIGLVNNQEDEPKPLPGFIKIKAANFAQHCFPGKVDLSLLLTDNDTWEIVETDVIRQVGNTFGTFGVYKTLSKQKSDGSMFFQILDPVTHLPLHDFFIFGIELNNHATRESYNVVTLFISEKETSGGSILGKDGKQYEVAVKALFMN